jgi:hypothetical protein
MTNNNRADGDSLKQIASFRRVAEELRGNRAKIVGLLKERAWHLAARRVRPGNA